MSDATMVLHFDAGLARNEKPRQVYVVLDPGANVVGAFHTFEEVTARHGKNLPSFGPIDVRPGVYRQYSELARQGSPTVYKRRNGRTERHSAPLTATLGSRSPDLRNMKRKLTTGKRQ